MIEVKTNKPFKLMDCVTFAVTMFFIAYYFLRLFGYYIDAISFVVPLILALAYMIFTVNWSERAQGYIIGGVSLVAVTTLIEVFCTEDLNFVSYVSMFTQLFMDVFPLYLAYNILKTGNKRLIIWTLAAIFITIIYVLIVTFIELDKDERFMREMSITYENYREFNATNAGGFQFAYAVAILIGLLAPLLFLEYKRNKKIKKIWIIIGFIASFILVLNSSYTLALLICVIVTLLTATYRLKNTSTKIIFGLLSVVGCLLLLAVSDWIVSLLPTEEMKLRLSEVFAFFKEGDSTGYNLNGRLSLYWGAIKAFFKSPITGNVKLDFDPHSSILRFFARDGILGGVGYLLLYYLGYRIVLKHFIGEKKKKFFTPVFLALILMGLVNPIHSVGAVHYIVFLVAPLTLSLIEIDKEEEDEEALGN